MKNAFRSASPVIEPGQAVNTYANGQLVLAAKSFNQLITCRHGRYYPDYTDGSVYSTTCKVLTIQRHAAGPDVSGHNSGWQGHILWIPSSASHAG